MPCANNKGAGQPAHPRSMISTFFGHCLDSIIPLVSISKISSLYQASAQASLSLPWSQTPKTGFLVTRLKYTEFLDRPVWAHNRGCRLRSDLQLLSDQGLQCLLCCLHLLTHYSIIKPHCVNFKIITAFFPGVSIF